jgi:serine/threonine protein kinase
MPHTSPHLARALLSAVAVQVRRLLQRLTNVSPLGTGIQGCVYSAYDHRTDSWVAVKLALVKVIGSSGPFEQVRMEHSDIKWLSKVCSIRWRKGLYKDTTDRLVRKPRRR